MDFHQWLTEVGDFRQALKAIDALDVEQRPERLVWLARQRLDFVQMGTLATKLDAVIASSSASARTVFGPMVKVALLSSHTVSHLAPSIKVAALGRGCSASVYVGNYGLWRSEIEDPPLALSAFAPDIVVVSLDAGELALDLNLKDDRAAVENVIGQRIAELRDYWRRARENLECTVVQETVLNTAYPVFGSYDGIVAAAPHQIVDMFNVKLREAVARDGIVLLDMDRQASLKGRENVIDWVRWHQAKQLISPRLAPWYADLLARIMVASRGLAKKCLILDLDNTLWGGVIGDDGLEGIVVGQGSAAGEAFVAFQRYVALLASRGVILAVCSKNDLAVAERAFLEHPDMVLRRDDISCFTANWSDKATNIRHIASELNIGLDSLVFVDDNPVERDIVRRELPMVAVPEMPLDIAGYPSRLSEAGYFETVAFSAEDTTRTKLYAEKSKRDREFQRATDIEGFLMSLDMVLEVGAVSKLNLSRVTQLLNKTNQFNLRTQKHSEQLVWRYAANAGTVALQLRLKDKFGDNGIIAVIIARPDDRCPADCLFIDTWLMSCRVLGRGVEAASLQALEQWARSLGIKTLIGEYLPTLKNQMVARHYETLGFEEIENFGQSGSEGTIWIRDLLSSKLAPPRHHIKVNIIDDQGADSRRAYDGIS